MLDSQTRRHNLLWITLTARRIVNQPRKSCDLPSWLSNNQASNVLPPAMFNGLLVWLVWTSRPWLEPTHKNQRTQERLGPRSKHTLFPTEAMTYHNRVSSACAVLRRACEFKWRTVVLQLVLVVLSRLHLIIASLGHRRKGFFANLAESAGTARVRSETDRKLLKDAQKNVGKGKKGKMDDEQYRCTSAHSQRI